MATGTGKTYTAFQIIWRLWKAAGRSASCSSPTATSWSTRPWSTTSARSARPWPRSGPAPRPSCATMAAPVDIATAIDHKRWIDTSYEIYLGLYQAITGPEERRSSSAVLSRVLRPHRHRRVPPGSAAEDSAWREILEYFTARNPDRTDRHAEGDRYVSNIDYFGEPLYTYSLKQGIERWLPRPVQGDQNPPRQGFRGLATGAGQHESDGEEVEDRIYNQKDFDRALVLARLIHHGLAVGGAALARDHGSAWRVVAMG